MEVHTLLALAVSLAGGATTWAAEPAAALAAQAVSLPRFKTPYGAVVNTPQSFRLAVADLMATFGDRYPRGAEYLAAYDAVEKRLAGLKGEALAAAQRELDALHTEALLANPLLAEIPELMFVRRGKPKKGFHASANGLPPNFTGNSFLYHGPKGWGTPCDDVRVDDEICILSPVRPSGKVRSVYKSPNEGWVGDVDLHWNGKKLLFSTAEDFPSRRLNVWEVNTDGTGLRQVSKQDGPYVLPKNEDGSPGKHEVPVIDFSDACYLPDGGIVCSSTLPMIGVPCLGGSIMVGNLYRMDANGGNIRRLTNDQVDNWCPTVLADGTILYLRWEYSDIAHNFSRRLFAMNPDGTNQRAVYGSNSYWPNGQYHARPIPGNPNRYVSLVTGHHGVARRGELILFDVGRGEKLTEGVIQRIPGHGLKVEPICADCPVKGGGPLFCHPYPLGDKYFLTSAQIPQRRSSVVGPDGKQAIKSVEHGLYLVDVFDNVIPLHEIPGENLFEPIPVRPTPVPPVIPDRVTPSAKTATVYLSDVYAGDGLRGVPRGTVKRLRVYAFHYVNGHEGGASWDVHRILGTVPVENDGSAAFTVPAMTPLAVQPLDEYGQAVQLMRSWFTAMPGEKLSCVGCHERQKDAPPSPTAKAMRRVPSPIEPFCGPERNYTFAEVAPVAKKYCTECHDGSQPARNHPRIQPFLFRPMLESDSAMMPAMEYHADSSPLIQMLRKGHHGVRLDRQSYERLVTWLDLNTPNRSGHGGRIAMLRQKHNDLYGGTAVDFDLPVDAPVNLDDPNTSPAPALPPVAPRAAKPLPICPNWPLPEAAACELQAKDGSASATLDLGDKQTLTLVRIPAGQFVMGSPAGTADEEPCVVRVERPFWVSTTEITNAMFRRFQPDHASGHWLVASKDMVGMGPTMNEGNQPATRLSWQQAAAFCGWLSKMTGGAFTLPTEAQWEWACRAGSDQAFAFGPADADWSGHANLAGIEKSGGYGLEKSIPTVFARDDRFADKHYATAPVGSYKPNAWGLHDMHGNVAEWTCSPYRPYPYKDEAVTGTPAADQYVVVRGGSFRDIPRHAHAGYRRAYRTWHVVVDVGFRVVCPEPPVCKTRKQGSPDSSWSYQKQGGWAHESPGHSRACPPRPVGCDPPS